MKKIMNLTLAAVAVLGLSACGGSSGGGYDDGYYPPEDPLITLFIVDIFNDRVSGIEYICDSTSGITGDGLLAGEFSFRDFDDCDFYIDNYIVLGDELFIVDVDYRGINDVPYTCNFDSGFTGEFNGDGEFFYDYGYDDFCTFEF